jgi:aerobic-type carbon monoxide dehydrogenase small subunit (CoxS/CutS family)
MTLRVNGAVHRLSIDTRTTVLDTLRERLGITGAKKCDHGQCGACTILLDGRRANSRPQDHSQLAGPRLQEARVPVTCHRSRTCTRSDAR